MSTTDEFIDSIKDIDKKKLVSSSGDKYSIVANAGYDNESIEGCDIAKKEAYALLKELQKTEEDLEDDERMRFSMARQLLDGTLTYEW